MSSARRGWVVALVMALSLTGGGGVRVARADTTQEAEAKERFGRGVDLYAQGDYGGALAEFKRAYDLAPYAVILFNLGLTYAALGRPLEAADAMDRVVKSPGSLSGERLAKARAVAAEQRARLAELIVEVNVANAVIDVDGVEVGTSPLTKPLQIKGGPHRVGAVAPGFAPSRKQVDVASGGREKLKFELAPTDKRVGHLDVRANVPGATLLVDGAPVGETPLATTLAVLPGSHEVEARRVGYRTTSRKIDVGEGSTGEVRLELTEDPDAMRTEGGDLVLHVDETQTVVFVDGKPQGSALGPLRLAPGPHALRVERAGFFPVEREIRVPARATLRVNVTLQPTADYRGAYEKKARFYRTGAIIGFIAGGAVTAGGITLALVAKGKRDDAADKITAASAQCANPADNAAFVECERIETTEIPNLNKDFDRNSTLMTAGWITAGIGGAIIVTGFTLLLVGDNPSRYDTRSDGFTANLKLKPTFSVTPQGAIVGLGGRF